MQKQPTYATVLSMEAIGEDIKNFQSISGSYILGQRLVLVVDSLLEADSFRGNEFYSDDCVSAHNSHVFFRIPKGLKELLALIP